MSLKRCLFSEMPHLPPKLICTLLLHFHLPSQFRLQLIEVRQRLFLGSIDPVFRSGSRGGHRHFQHPLRFSSLSAERRSVQKQQHQGMAWEKRTHNLEREIYIHHFRKCFTLPVMFVGEER